MLLGAKAQQIGDQASACCRPRLSMLGAKAQFPVSWVAEHAVRYLSFLSLKKNYILHFFPLEKAAACFFAETKCSGFYKGEIGINKTLCRVFSYSNYSSCIGLVRRFYSVSTSLMTAPFRALRTGFTLKEPMRQLSLMYTGMDFVRFTRRWSKVVV